MVSGQRFMGATEAGEIMIPSIMAVMDVYVGNANMHSEERERLLRWILHIDRLVREEGRKRKKERE
jgi:hypothetical protein